MSGGGADGAGPLRSVHHVGITVESLERAVAFWERLVGATARDYGLLDGPRVGELVGYPGVRIDRCWLDLPGGVSLELLEYLDRPEAAYEAGTAHPGNVHVCMAVADMDAALEHALGCGARPVSPGAIDVRRGPSAGARVVYVRGPDGVTIELFQPPTPQDDQGRGSGH